MIRPLPRADSRVTANASPASRRLFDRRSPALWIALLAIVLALAFLGARGIWDPDEGRYTNVGINMMASGDWLFPHRNADVDHWTKPPLTYWAIGASTGLFGLTAWAARLPAALSYLICTWLAWRCTRRLAPGAQATGALAYATMLLTFGASQWITTDYVLAACTGLATWAYVEARFGSGDARRWILLMWLGFGLAFLTKGPPGLLPLLGLVVFNRLAGGGLRLLQLPGLVLFAVVALPWYAYVTAHTPGLLGYFLGDEVVGRIASNEFDRSGQWYGWIVVYAPTLLIGTLPWTPALLRWLWTLRGRLHGIRHDVARRDAAAPTLLLALWGLLPLVVFCLARSRMPLYLLPLFLPLAIAVAAQRQSEGRALPRWPWLAGWAVFLLALKLASAYWPTHKDAEQWAQAVRARVDHPVHRTVIVEDMARYGLRLHLDTQVYRVILDPRPEPRFNPSYDETLEQELTRPGGDRVWIAKQERYPVVIDRLASHGYAARPLGAPYRGRIIFDVVPTSAVGSAATP